MNRGIHSEQVRERIALRDDEFDDRLEHLGKKLLAERSRRVPPATDDKILASGARAQITSRMKGRGSLESVKIRRPPPLPPLPPTPPPGPLPPPVQEDEEDVF